MAHISDWFPNYRTRTKEPRFTIEASSLDRLIIDVYDSSTNSLYRIKSNNVEEFHEIMGLPQSGFVALSRTIKG